MHRLPLLLPLLVTLACTPRGPALPGSRSGPPAPIPAPSGDWAVGGILLDVPDPEPADPQGPMLPHLIEAQVWYPAHSGARGEAMPYLPRGAALEQLVQRRYFDLPPARLATWPHQPTHTLRGVLPGVVTGGFPVLLFSPGRGIALANYTALLEELASRGYVVIGVEQRVAAPGGIRRTSSAGPDDVAERRTRVAEDDVERWAADLELVLRSFSSSTGSVAEIARRADLTRAGAFGHGAGGAVALLACARSIVLRRCAALDAPLAEVTERLERPERPVLVVRSRPALDDVAWLESDAAANRAWLERLARGPDGSALARVQGATPLDFSDAPFVMPEAVADARGSEIGGERAIRLAAELLDVWFAAERADGAAAIDSLGGRYLELSRSR